MAQMINNCPICDAKTKYALLRYVKNYLVRCKKCSFVFSERKPTTEELEVVYGRYNYEGAEATAATLEKKYKIAKYLMQLSGGGGVMERYWMWAVERESGLMPLSDWDGIPSAQNSIET